MRQVFTYLEQMPDAIQASKEESATSFNKVSGQQLPGPKEGPRGWLQKEGMGAVWGEVMEWFHVLTVVVI